MENNSENRSVTSPGLLLDTVSEQLADADITLPDYCPDIEKILKCTLKPQIRSKLLSGGRLAVDGTCTVCVLYIESERKTVRSCEHQLSFSQSFTVRDGAEPAVILTRTKPEYVNCRALSPRRLVIHGAFSLYATVAAPETAALFEPEEELECLRTRLDCCRLTALCQEQFSVSEEISAADKPPVESVLYTCAAASVTDSKAVTGKLMVNGEINLKVFYLTDIASGETAKLDYIIPFNQIIDCAGISDSTRNLIGCELMSCDLRLKNDIMGDRPSLILDAKLCLTVEGYETDSLSVVTDAYSVKCESTPQFATLKTVGEAIPVSEGFMEKLSVTLDGGKISKILDIFPDSHSLESKLADGVLTACGKINLCMLALDENGQPIFVERAHEYNRKLTSAEGCAELVFPELRVAGISYRLASDNEAELRCELKITGGAVRNESNQAVESVELHEDSPASTDKSALTLYFASAGERFWDIAKAHSTRLSLLTEENSAETESVESARMLLIPKA